MDEPIPPDGEPTYRELLFLDDLRHMPQRDHDIVVKTIKILADPDADPIIKEMVSELMQFAARQVKGMLKELRRLERRVKIAEGRLKKYEQDAAVELAEEITGPS